jgi:TonB-linked SusC/RagA family outer membrane protein
MKMRATVIFLLIGITQAFSVDLYSQNTRLSLNMKNTTIKSVLNAIENQTDFYFIYEANNVDVDRKVSLFVEDETIPNILDNLFSNTGIAYRMDNRRIALTHLDFGGIAQSQKTVSGQVTDSNGQPLPGVTVVVKGTTQGTITGADGNYTLTNVSSDAILVFSFVGMKTQEMVVGSKTAINLSLVEDTIGLEEVVAVGYGTQKKVNLTGAVDVVTAEKLSNRQAPNVSQLLQGLVPGANFSISGEGGFEPGAKLDISIRGIGSLNGGEPYIVIDGFPGNINNINPEDIESISVLKDASASAIYGARAAYGVILITTKRGNKQEKFSVTYNGNMFVKTPGKLPESLDSYTWARLINDAGYNKGGTNYAPEQLARILAYQREDWDYLKQSMPDWPEGATIFGAYPEGNVWNNSTLNYANTDWWNVYYGHSVNQSHDISVQGGSDNASYYFSAGYLGDEGVLNYGTDDFRRINVTGKVNLAISDWWDFSWETLLSKQDRERPNNFGDGYTEMFRQISRAYPITPLYDGWGNFMSESHVPQIESGTDKSDLNDYWNKFRMEIRPLKGWKINADFAYNTSSGITTSIQNTVYNYMVDKSVQVQGKSIPNSIERISQDYSYWTTNVYSSYEFSLANHHNFNILAGIQFEKGKSTKLSGYKTDMIVADVPSFQTATGSAILSENLSHNATEGYFARFNYNYKEKYLFESNMRYDGSYVFRKGNRWGFFPSFSMGWNVHRESFWKVPEEYITTLKVRVSWGQLGNQDISPYSDLELIPLNTGKLDWIFNYGENRPVGYTEAPGIVNRDLTWETATMKDLGMNISFLRNRLKADFDWFERLTEDMVGPAEAKPGVLGANVPKMNNSELRTRGWELSLNWSQDLKCGLSYFVNFNLYDYKSVVTKYLNPTGTLSTWYEGQEVGEIWGFTVHDLFRTQEELNDYLATTDLSYFGKNWRTGDVKYEDANNDFNVDNGQNTVDDHGDLSIIGNSEPHYQYGITAGLNFKGFDFSMLWKGIAKKDVYFTREATLFWGFAEKRGNGTLTPYHLDYFRDEPGTEISGLYEGDANINLDAYFPRPYLNKAEEQKNKDHPNTRYLQDASYVRLQNVQVGYSLSRDICSKLNLQKLRIYFSGENLITLTSLPDGIDPMALLGNDGVEGRLTNPADRIFSLGISITY